MTRALLVARTSAVSKDREAEFHDWYDNDHLPEILALPGFSTASRYQLSSAQIFPDAAEEASTLVLYQVDTDDINAFAKTLADYAKNPGFHFSPALSADPAPVIALYELAGPQPQT